MKLYLTVILGLGFTTNTSVAAIASPVPPRWVTQESQPQTDAPQEPSKAKQPNSKPAEATQPNHGAAPDKISARQEPSRTRAIASSLSPVQTQKTPPSAPAKKSEAAAKTATTKRRRKRVVAKTVSEPEKKVVRNGGTANPPGQLAPGVSNEQATRQRQTTTELLASTDANLRQLASRQLNSTEQDSVSQIRKYMEQARSAEVAGDVQRAQNLASKALMLSDDLVKP